MLRNYTETLNGRLVSGTNRVGVLGSVILGVPSGGDFGPGIFNGYEPLNPAAYYRAIVLTSTGAFVLNEDGSGEAAEAFTATLRLLEDNVEFATGVPLDGGFGSEIVLAFQEQGDDAVSVLGAPNIAATLAFSEGTADQFAIVVGVQPVHQATIAAIDGVPDQVTVMASVQAIRDASLAYTEQGADQAAVVATIRVEYEGSVAIVEEGSDTVAVSANVRQSTLVTAAFLESADDSVQVSAAVATAFPAFLAFNETGDDRTLVEGIVASSVARSGTLAALAAEYVTLRSASGLFIGYEQVLQCAINATRFYAGWATIEDPASRLGVFAITGDTVVTTDEWATIAPLFRLYCDREHAVVVEASATLGLQPVGKSSSEVSAEIQQVETELPQKAYVEETWSVGLPPVQ